MNIEDLDYTAYEHRFSDDTVVKLKEGQALEEVENNLLLIADNNAKWGEDITWFLNVEKKKSLSEKSLKIESCISWHMGIPFYGVTILQENTPLIYIAEFYLDTVK